MFLPADIFQIHHGKITV